MKLKLLFIFGLISLTSCGTYKHQTSNRSADEIKQLHYFSPIAYIHHIEKGNRSAFSDSLSDITRTQLDSILSNNTNLRTSTKIEITDSVSNAKYEEELTSLFNRIMQGQQVETLDIPPTIDSILSINNTDFSLATLSIGFGRKKGNYTGQAAKAIGVGILTLGMYAPIPVKSNLSVYALIFDAKNNNVAFYRRTPVKEESPTDPTALYEQLEWLFDGYFY